MDELQTPSENPENGQLWPLSGQPWYLLDVFLLCAQGKVYQAMPTRHIFAWRNAGGIWEAKEEAERRESECDLK